MKDLEMDVMIVAIHPQPRRRIKNSTHANTKYPVCIPMFSQALTQNMAICLAPSFSPGSLLLPHIRQLCVSHANPALRACHLPQAVVSKQLRGEVVNIFGPVAVMYSRPQFHSIREDPLCMVFHHGAPGT